MSFAKNPIVDASRWESIVRNSVEQFGTPQYLFRQRNVFNALDALQGWNTTVPVKHWLSFKTSPLSPLLRAWNQTKLGVEVVSEFELRAAIHEGFSPDRILINGVAKHRWLPKVGNTGYTVNFDSITEVEELADVAAHFSWRVGLRYHPATQSDPDEPQYETQFGMNTDELAMAKKTLEKVGLKIDGIHFHLRSNVPIASDYSAAIHEVAEKCRELNLKPRYLDCGGGFPVSGERSTLNEAFVENFNVSQMLNIVDEVPKLISSVEEVWFENGRRLTSSAGVLVVRVCDVKNRPSSRFLICDGGRVNHAMVSDWELHDIFVIPMREGSLQMTTICGPNCMAYDRLARIMLPDDVQVDDIIVWMNAGAYHIPWETKFSHGRAAIVWEHMDGSLQLVRPSETFQSWWSHENAVTKSEQL